MSFVHGLALSRSGIMHIAKLARSLIFFRFYSASAMSFACRLSGKCRVFPDKTVPDETPLLEYILKAASFTGDRFSQQSKGFTLTIWLIISIQCCKVTAAEGFPQSLNMVKFASCHRKRDTHWTCPSPEAECCCMRAVLHARQQSWNTL